MRVGEPVGHTNVVNDSTGRVSLLRVTSSVAYGVQESTNEPESTKDGGYSGVVETWQRDNKV